MSDDDILAAIRTVWESLSIDQPFASDRPLIDTGADSLQLMQFALRLEEATGRRIPYDVLTPETTPRTLAASLIEPVTARTDLPRMFFLPGLGGDNGMLPMLRETFAGQMVFTLAEAPGGNQPDELLGDLEATAAHIAGAIAAAQPEGDIRLSGYSMGGLQAFEVARHLMRAGREVSLLCLFDAAPVRGTLRRLLDGLRAPRRSLAKLRQLLLTVRPSHRLGAYRSLRVAVALRLGAYGYAAGAARATAAADAPADYGEPAIFRLWSQRVAAARRWRPTPLGVPTVLIVSDDGLRWGVDRFWRRLASPLTVLPVGGTHDQLASRLSDVPLASLVAD